MLTGSRSFVNPEIWASSAARASIGEFLDEGLDFAMVRIDIAAGQARGRLNYLCGLADRHSGKMEKQEFIAGIREMLGGAGGKRG